MSGKAVLDTNVVLDLLGDRLSPRNLPDVELMVSVITELELLSYPMLSLPEEKSIRKFLSNVEITGLSDEIKRKTIALRKSYRLKLPDAIICATAMVASAPLITNDKRLSKVAEISVLIPS
ncbi:MAG: type II toxin-antitoxin system VapC family toxin [Ignavibacteriae bacterium]|nr:type II toxin-antitoxin system VapC family toxin [Ignavibacteriota bacterium]